MFQGAFSKLTLFLFITIFEIAFSQYAWATDVDSDPCAECYASAGTSDIAWVNLNSCLRRNQCTDQSTKNPDAVGTPAAENNANPPPRPTPRTAPDMAEEDTGQSEGAAGDAAEGAEAYAARAEENCNTIRTMADSLEASKALSELKDKSCKNSIEARMASDKGDLPTAKKYSDYSDLNLENAKRIQTQEREFANLRRKLEEEAEICRKAHGVAQECCSNPESCLQKPDGVPSEKDGAVGDAIKTALGVAGSVPASSVSAMCGKMKTMGNIMTAFNGYLAVQCSRTVGQCKNKCKVSPELTAQIREKCESNYDSEMCINVRTLKEELDNYTEHCAIADNGSMELAKQAIVSQAASKYADTCKKMAEEIAAPTGEDLKPTDLFANTSCANPTAQTMAFCQAQCSRPGAQQDPNCAAFLGKLNNSGLGQFNNGGVDPNSLLSDLNVGDEGTQNPNFQDIAPVNAGSTGVGAGGGGGLLGSGAPQGGGSDDGDGGSGEAGHNTKIDRGLASGNGYSGGGSRMMSGSGGGFSGYGNSKAITNSGKAFNLKDFLPNNKAPLKPFRGLASVSQEISPAHDDIFKKVTARFYQLCLRDALYDCSTLQKLKSGRD